MRCSRVVLLATDDDELGAEIERALSRVGIYGVRVPTGAQMMARLAACRRPVRLLLCDAQFAGGQVFDALQLWAEWSNRSLPRVIFWADERAQPIVRDRLSWLIDIEAHEMALPLDLTALAGLTYQHMRGALDLWRWTDWLRAARACPATRPHPWQLRRR